MIGNKYMYILIFVDNSTGASIPKQETIEKHIKWMYSDATIRFSYIDVDKLYTLGGITKLMHVDMYDKIYITSDSKRLRQQIRYSVFKEFGVDLYINKYSKVAQCYSIHQWRK